MMWTYSLSPDQAILLLTLGVLLIYVELNRPGWIVPGALGLLAALIAMAALMQDGIRPVAAVLCATAIALFAVALRRTVPWVVAAAATLPLALGLAQIDANVHAVIAVPCGLLLGAGTSLLTRIARRARVNKGLD
jgi:membrane-bound serine protease (ClpP class)